MAEKKSRKGVGGWQGHRDGCRCNPCKANRRKAGEVVQPPVVKQRVLVDTTDPDFTTDLVLAAPPHGDKNLFNAAAWAKGKMEGLSEEDIAENLGISKASLRRSVRLSVESGKMRLEDPADIIENEIVPQATKTVGKAVSEGDVKTSLEVLKGTGQLKSHAAVKTEHKSTEVIAVVNITPPPDMGTYQQVGLGRGNVIDVTPVEVDSE